MSDDRTLGGNPDETPRPTPPGDIGSLATNAVETVLDLDEVMSQARLVEKVAHICLRGDLQAELDETLEELAGLVDQDGRLLRDDEDSLADADAARAEELDKRQVEIKREMRTSMRAVRFRALPDDEWQGWFKALPRDSKGDIKDPEASNTDLIARTAIEPTMTADQVEGLRKKLGAPAIVELSNKAWQACTTGGVDVPKSPTFLLAPRRDSSGRN